MQHGRFSMLFTLILILFCGIVNTYENQIKIGVILTDENGVNEWIIDNVFGRKLSFGPQLISYQVVKETVYKQDALHYHRAVCNLLQQGTGVLLSSTDSTSHPILASYSNDYNISLVSPELLEAPDDPKAPDFITPFAVGIRPSTTRPVLDLIRDLGWQKLLYFYDKDHGTENLQIMFRVGYSTLNIKLSGFACVSNAREANLLLKRYRGTQIHVVLDMDPELALKILQLYVHSNGAGNQDFRFILTQPTLINFWQFPEIRALKMMGFLISLPYTDNSEWERLLSRRDSLSKQELVASNYYNYDAASFLSEAVKELSLRSIRLPSSYNFQGQKKSDCSANPPDGRLAQIIKKVHVDNGLTGKLEFPVLSGHRYNTNFTILKSSHKGYEEYGSWSFEGNAGGIRKSTFERRSLENNTQAQISNKRPVNVVTIISPPYTMLKKSDNSTEVGNDRFEGYCIDILHLICEKLNLDCRVHLVEVGTYGRFDPDRERWNGMIGEIITAKADLALGDMMISARRQKIVEFTDPFELVSLNLLMKNPDSVRATTSMFFPFSAFAPSVWICILVAILIFAIAFHLTTNITGAPDSIESASGIWGRKNAITMNVWFAMGSSMLQNTGVYPRSISSRILSCSWWFGTSIFACLFIASITSQLLTNISGEKSPQLMNLKSLSLESILREAMEKGWPKVGVVDRSPTLEFLKSSTLPLYVEYISYLKNNPDLKVSSRNEGIRRVRESNGGYILMAESTSSDYDTRQAPCDLVNSPDSFSFTAYGFAFSPSMDATLRRNITHTLTNMQEGGILGHLHRKWWIESSQCKKPFVEDTHQGNLHAFSGLFCILLGGLALISIAFVIQYYMKRQDKEIKRQQLTFDDLNLDNRLPTPPPELLVQPPPVATMTRL